MKMEFEGSNKDHESLIEFYLKKALVLIKLRRYDDACNELLKA